MKAASEARAVRVDLTGWKNHNGQPKFMSTQSNQVSAVKIVPPTFVQDAKFDPCMFINQVLRIQNMTHTTCTAC